MSKEISPGEIYPLTSEFSRDPNRQKLWAGFIKRMAFSPATTSSNRPKHSLRHAVARKWPMGLGNKIQLAICSLQFLGILSRKI